MPQVLRLIMMVAVGLWSLTACAAHSPAQRVAARKQACCQSRYPAPTFSTTSTAQLGAEYRRLKRQKCPRCGNDFSALLRVLGERLNGQPRSLIQQVLGPPDQVRSDSLRYYCRGEHDYLYFWFWSDQRGHSAFDQRGHSAWCYPEG